MAPTTRRNLLILNYFVLVVHNVLFVLSLGVVGLSGNMLYWAAESDDTNTTYVLDSRVLSERNPPSSSDIMEFPAGFRLLGTKLVLAAGIVSIIATSISMALIFIWSLRPVKYNIPIVNTPGFFILPLISLTTTTIMLTALSYSWSEYYNVPSLIFSSTTTKSSIYLLKTQTPETWLKALSHSVLDTSNQKSLHDLYVLAATSRILLAPMLALQSTALLTQLMLRSRTDSFTPTTHSPPSTSHSSNRNMEKLRSSLLEQAYQRRPSRIDLERNTRPHDPAAQYTNMVRETAETTRVWRVSTLVGGANRYDYEPTRLDEFCDTPATLERRREMEWVAKLDGRRSGTEETVYDEKIGLAVHGEDDEEDIGDMYQRYQGWEALRDRDRDRDSDVGGESWFDEPGFEEVRGRSQQRW